MKYTPSALVSQFSGKQGSTVASHNRYGPYFRNRVIPVNPNTLAQQNARNNLAAAAAAWATLTAGQRAGWEAFAASQILYDRLGRPYTPTGAQMYTSCARSIYVYDPTAALPGGAPTSVQPAALLTVTPTASAAATLTFAYTATPAPASTKVLIECTRQVSAGISFLPRSEYKQISVTAAAAASPAAIGAAYVARFGSLIATRRVFYRLTMINSDGLRSAPLGSSVVVA